MTDAQWQRVRDAFERGADRDPADVTAWLDVEAADDPDVQAEVASLLRHHSRAGDFLAEPVTARVSHLLTDDARFEAGATVGPYTIQREIGRGGMGRVYLATDCLGRTRRAKALLPRSSGTRDSANACAAGGGSGAHPGICTILRAREVDDVFIAAEYVGGVPGDRVRRDAGEELTMTAVAGRCLPVRTPASRIAIQAGKHHARQRRPRRSSISGPRSFSRTGTGAVSRVTATGASSARPVHVAEQLNGATADARSDVFALGVPL